MQITLRHSLRLPLCTGLSLALGLLLVGLLAGCAGGEDDGPSFTFLRARELWEATKAQAAINELARPSGEVEQHLQITVENEDTGEQLTFMAIIPGGPAADGSGPADAKITDAATATPDTSAQALEELSGTYPIRVFGSLATLDTQKGYERLRGVSNACSPNDLSLTSGSLSIEGHDPQRRLLTGSFIANVCLVDDADQAWTLGDGKFAEIPY